MDEGTNPSKAHEETQPPAWLRSAWGSAAPLDKESPSDTVEGHRALVEHLYRVFPEAERLDKE